MLVFSKFVSELPVIDAIYMFVSRFKSLGRGRLDSLIRESYLAYS